METWGSVGIAPPFLILALDGGDQLHDPAAYTRGKSLRYPLVGGFQSRSGRRGEEKHVAPVGNLTRTVKHIAYRSYSSLRDLQISDYLDK
jgi:hypothetical protein